MLEITTTCFSLLDQLPLRRELTFRVATEHCRKQQTSQKLESWVVDMLTSYMDLGLHFAREQEAAVSNGSRQFDLPGTKIEKNHGANGEFQSVARVSSYLSSFACVHVCNHSWWTGTRQLDTFTIPEKGSRQASIKICWCIIAVLFFRTAIPKL